MRLLDIAQVAHEANRAYCDTIGDTSQLPWHEAPTWQHKSALDGVQAILRNPSLTSADSHANWLAHKEAEGWKYGPVKNAETREHPCCVPYTELPADQQVKDHLFRHVVLALLASYTPEISNDEEPATEAAATGG